MINVDHGILPASTTELKHDLNLNNVNIGLLGSLVYLGLVLGSVFAMPVFKYCNAKLVIILCIFCNAGALMMFTMSEDFYILACSRLLVGFFQVLII